MSAPAASRQLGSMLARLRHKVLLVDADPQSNLTSFFTPDNPGSEDAEKEEGSDEEESGEENGQEGEEAPPSTMAAAGVDVLPPVGSDRTVATSSMSPEDVFAIASWREDRHNLLSVLTELSIGNASHLPTLMPCNTEEYGCRLLLLPGSARLHTYCNELTQTATTAHATRTYGGFRKVLLDLGRVHGLDYVLIDCSPSVDILNQTIIMSCDALQSLVDPSVFSWSSTTEFYSRTLPTWMDWRRTFNPRALTRDADFAFNPHPPRILPVLGMRHVIKSRSRIDFSSSNLFDSIRQTLNDERIPAAVRRLFLPAASGSGDSATTTMLLPFCKQLTGMPVAQELGRPLFDLSNAVLAAYFAGGSRPSQGALTFERQYLAKRYESLARAVEVARDLMLGPAPAGAGAGAAAPQQQQAQLPRRTHTRQQQAVVAAETLAAAREAGVDVQGVATRTRAAKRKGPSS